MTNRKIADIVKDKKFLARRKGLGDFRPENMARKDTEADGSNVRWGSKSGAAETAKVAVCGYKKQVPR